VAFFLATIRRGLLMSVIGVKQWRKVKFGDACLDKDCTICGAAIDVRFRG
jgi:hypothetical protein